MLQFRLISLQSATWAVASATGLISQLLDRFDQTASDDYSQRSLLAQCIQMLRIFSNFISDEQLSEINENPLADLETLPMSLDILAGVASQELFDMEDNV